MRLEVQEDVADEALEHPVGGEQVGADDGDGDDDDDRRRHELRAPGPVDLAKLGPGLACEGAHASAALALGPGLALRLGGGLDLTPSTGARALRLRGSLEVAALPASAGRTRQVCYLVSRCSVWPPHQRQYFLASKRSGVFRFDF